MIQQLIKHWNGKEYGKIHYTEDGIVTLCGIEIEPEITKIPSSPTAIKCEYCKKILEETRY